MKVLIIGLGSIAQKHIHALERVCDTIEIASLRSSKDAIKYSNVVDYYSYDSIKFQPDFIIISNPTYLHFQTILKAIKFNCPLIIEKPSLGNSDGINDLLKQIESNKIITYVACNLRFLPCIQYIKKYVVNNKPIINEINCYCGSYLPDWRPDKDFRKSYSSNIEKGGGVHLDLIHEIDYLYWIFGTPLKVIAFQRNVSDLKISAMDYANYNLLYNNFTANIVLNYYRKDKKRTFEIVFKDKTWLINLLTNTISEGGKTIFKSQSTILDTYTDQLEYFINCLQKNITPMNSLAESIDVLKICLTNQLTPNNI